MRSALVLVAASVVLLASCPGRKDVECVDSSNCDRHPGGVCATAASGNQWCAYPDAECPGGLRYSDVDVGDGLGGVCVMHEVDAGIDATPVDSPIDGPPDVTPPSVQSVSPLDQSTSAGTGAAITAMFSEDILPSSANATTFRVQAGAMMVPGNIVTNGDLVSFMPQTRLSPSTTYSVTLSSAITDLAGNPLAQPYTWSFQTSAGGWTTPTLLETELNKQASGLYVSFAGGHGIAAWSMVDCVPTCGMTGGPWFARYGAGAWAEGVAIPSLAGKSPVTVTADAQGRFMLFLSGAGTVRSLEAAWFDGTAWSAPALIENDDTGNATNARAATDGTGNVIAVWEQQVNGTIDVWANRYVVGTGWGSAVRVDASTVSAFDPAVAVHTDGTATAVWIQNSMIMGSRFASASGWSAPVPIGPATASQPEIAYAGDGVPTAIWRDGTNLRASRFIGAWSEPVSINGATGAPQTALALAGSRTSGRVAALWMAGPTGFQSLYQAVYSPGTGWGAFTTIDVLAGAVNFPDVTFGQGDQALATWAQPQGAAGNPAGAWSNTFGPAVGWGDPQLVFTDGTNTVTDVETFYDSVTNTFGAIWLKPSTNPTSVFQARLQ